MELTLRDVAKLLDVPERTVQRWVDKAQLPAYKVSDELRFHRAEILEWATSKNVVIPPGLFDDTEAGGSALPSLAEALQAGGFLRGIRGADRDAVLKNVVEGMRLPESVDRDFLWRMLIAREQAGTTAVGGGIAMPHPRNPIVLHDAKPAVTVAFLAQGVEFGAPDDEPVQVLFTLTAPSVRVHLHLLSCLAHALRDDGFRNLVERAAPDEALLAEVRRIDAQVQARGSARESGTKPAADPGRRK